LNEHGGVMQPIKRLRKESMLRLASLAFPTLIAAALLPDAGLMAQSKPADAATAFFNALTAGEWRRAARLVDPDALAEARTIELGMLVSWAEARPDLQRIKDGGMQGISFGGELDTSLLKKHRDLIVDLLGVRTLGEVAALSPEELFARSLEASTHPLVRGERANLRPPTYRVIGIVQETDSVAHVLYRMTSPDVSYEDPWHVAVLRAVRRGDQWLVRPDRELAMFSGTSLLFQRMHEEEGPPE
jgi:hypothetical protein